MIGIIANIEDDSYEGKDFKKVTLADGSILKVKSGREGYLKAKWGELEIGKTYEWEMGSFQDKPFVKDFKAITSPAPPPTTPLAPAPSQPGMTPDMWTEKDRLKRFSIESQTAFTGIMEVATACIEKETNIGGMVRFLPVYDAALDWAMARLQPNAESPSLAVTTKSGASTTDSKGFANTGEFYTACNAKYKLTKSKVDPQIVGCDLTTVEGRQAAWTLIAALFGEQAE